MSMANSHSCRYPRLNFGVVFIVVAAMSVVGVSAVHDSIERFSNILSLSH